MKYYIRYEQMNGEWFYMIYSRFLWFHAFFERWNTADSVIVRLNELTGFSGSGHENAESA